MRVVRREFHSVARRDVFNIKPLGDVHIGSAACDEVLLQAWVDDVKRHKKLWIGMGDYCEFINMRDKRFDAGVVADWVEVADLVDLAKAQRDRFLDIVLPIADQCLCLLEGNHELQIRKHTERDIYSEIVSAIKGRAKRPADEPLGVGMSGWLRTLFYHAPDKQSVKRIDWRLHHGFVGGRLAGAKALNMQRWLWSHRCNIALFAHSHNTMIQPEAVEYLDNQCSVKTEKSVGAFCGSFLRSYNEDGPATYSEEKGYFPLPIGGVEIELRPHTKTPSKIRMIYES